MSLIKRGNVWWAYSYLDGIRQQHSTDTSNRRQAEIIEAKLKEQARASRFQSVQADPKIKFGELAAHFLASASVRPYHIPHLRMLLPFFAEVQVSRFSQTLADQFRRRRHADAIVRSCKDSAINRNLAVLRHILYWGVDEQFLAIEPAGPSQDATRPGHPSAGAKYSRRATPDSGRRAAASAYDRRGPGYRDAPRRDHNPALGGH